MVKIEAFAVEQVISPHLRQTFMDRDVFGHGYHERDLRLGHLWAACDGLDVCDEELTPLQWMDKYELTAKYNTAETCCASISIDDLRELSEDKDANPLTALQSTKLTYGAIRGSDKLRETLSNLYSAKIPGLVSKDNVLITAGAIQANFLLLYTLVGPGDHIICHYPTYQQLYSVPASLGAEVSLWKSKQSNDWQLDIEELKSLIRPNTKLIIIKCV
jgi:DNA-binding transcriptional MocR family regulator